MPALDPTSFAALCGSTVDGDSARAEILPGWAQGRATFGGLLLGMAIAAARQRLPEPRPCRSIAASFPAPAAPGALEVLVRTLRHGRAVSHLHVELQQGGDAACIAVLAFGAARASTVVVPPPSRPALGLPEGLPSLPNPAYPAPEFTRHLDYRLGFGERPYTSSTASELGGWCRFRNPGPLGAEHVAALIDAWPSPAVSRLAVPGPAATITWGLELLPIEADVAADGWWLYHAELEAAGDGYAHTAARLWSPAGRLAAFSRQAVAVFG